MLTCFLAGGFDGNVGSEPALKKVLWNNSQKNVSEETHLKQTLFLMLNHFTCRPPCSLSFDIPDGEGAGRYQVNMSENIHI